MLFQAWIRWLRRPIPEQVLSRSGKLRSADGIVGWDTQLSEGTDQFQMQNLESAPCSGFTACTCAIRHGAACKRKVRAERFCAQDVRTPANATVEYDLHSVADRRHVQVDQPAGVVRVEVCQD